MERSTPSPTAEFAEGANVVDANNPSRVGVTTGRTRALGLTTLIEVSWGPHEREFVPYPLLKTFTNSHATIESRIVAGGCCASPYEDGIEAAFDPRWGLNAVSQPLPVPDDVDWPENNGISLFKRFSVAYGLSFLPSDHPIQHFPDEIGEFDPAENHPKRDIPSAPSKDEV